MFGKKRPTGQNVLLLDIENASVGVALVHLEKGGAPVLFAEHRTALALPRTLHSDSIAKQIEAATHEALLELGLVAARLRGNSKTADKGELSSASVFLGAPWGVPNLALGKAQFSPRIQTFIADEIRALAPQAPLSFYTGADSAVYGSTLLRTDSTMLVALVRGEIIELVLLGEQGPLGYATLPAGSNTIYRTLQTHAGLSLAEVHALLALVGHPIDHHHEPLAAAGQHLIRHFAVGVETLVRDSAPQSLMVVAEEPIGSWFARTLESEESLGALFAKGAKVRVFGGKHVARHLETYTATPDLHLALDALFVDHKSKARSRLF